MAAKKITYGEAIHKIEEIIHQIENDELDVDNLSEKVKEVTSLLKYCKDKLYKTEKDVENILNEINE